MSTNEIKTLSIKKAVEEIKTPLQKNRLVIFAGLGVSASQPSKLPNRDEFSRQFIEFYKTSIFPYLSKKDQEKDYQTIFSPLLDHPSPENASKIQTEFKKIQSKILFNFEDVFKRWFNKLFAVSMNDNHTAIVSTNYLHIVTSSYDNLLEKASQESKFVLHFNSHPYNDPRRMAYALFEDKTAIIHTQSNLFNGVSLGDLIFTADDYAQAKKKYPNSMSVISSLLDTYSILFVGYDIHDFELKHFMKEIDTNLDLNSAHPLAPHYFITLPEEQVSDFTKQYQSRLRANLIPLNDDTQMTELLQALKEVEPRPIPEPIV